MTQRDDLLGRLKELHTGTKAHRATSRVIRAMIFDGDYAGATTALDTLEDALHPALAAGGGTFDPDTTFGEWGSRNNLGLDISVGWHPLAFDAGLDRLVWQPDGWESGLDGTQEEEDYNGLDLAGAVFAFPDGLYFFRYSVQLDNDASLHSDAAITLLLGYSSDYSAATGAMAIGPLFGASPFVNKSAKHNPGRWEEFVMATMVAPFNRVFLQVNAFGNDGGLTVNQWNLQGWKLA